MKDNPLKEFGKEYFRNLLKKKTRGFQYGDTFSIRIQYFDSVGKVHCTQTEIIKKEEL